MEKIKILLISAIFPPQSIGGYELRALDMAKKLNSDGFIVRVLTSDYFTDDQNELHYLDVHRELQYIPWNTEKNWILGSINKDNLKRIVSQLINFKPDIVLLFDTRGISGILIYFFFQNLSIPIVHVIGDDNFTFLHNSNIRKTMTEHFGNFDFPNFYYIPVSYKVAKEIHRNSGIIMKQKMISPSWYLEGSKQSSKFKKKNKFIFASTLAGTHKGLQIAIDAFKTLFSNGITDFSLDIFGGGDQQTIENLNQIIIHHGLQNHVFYKGKLSKIELLKKYCEYDVFILPTWQREPCGCVFAEAASAGTLPIMTNACGASEYFLDGYDCIKASRDVESFARAIKKYMDVDKEKAEKMRKNAIDTAKHYFCFANLYKNHIEIFNKVAKPYTYGASALRKIEQELYMKADAVVNDLKDYL